MGKSYYNWSDEKNALLKQSERNVSFEMVISAIAHDCILDIIDNPSANHPHQKCYVLEINGYVYLVPFVTNGDEIFLKTIFPSRKHTRFYLSKREENEQE